MPSLTTQRPDRSHKIRNHNPPLPCTPTQKIPYYRPSIPSTRPTKTTTSTKETMYTQHPHPKQAQNKTPPKNTPPSH